MKVIDSLPSTAFLTSPIVFVINAEHGFFQHISSPSTKTRNSLSLQFRHLAFVLAGCVEADVGQLLDLDSNLLHRLRRVVGHLHVHADRLAVVVQLEWTSVNTLLMRLSAAKVWVGWAGNLVATGYAGELRYSNQQVETLVDKFGNITIRKGTVPHF